MATPMSESMILRTLVDQMKYRDIARRRRKLALWKFNIVLRFDGRAAS
jgi:hypothetical protein